MTNQTILTMVLRLPSKNHHPNVRKHWAVKSSSIKKDREYAYVMALAAKSENFMPWSKATIKAVFVLKRDHDDDNLIAWLKPYRDGFADAGLVPNDKMFKMLPPETIKGKCEQITITIQESA